MERYERHTLLKEIGPKGQLLLGRAKVAVVGAGGLGTALLPYLAAAGVGHIAVFDPDCIVLSNLQRQVIYREKDIGKPKATKAVQHLKKINSQIDLRGHIKSIDANNALEHLAGFDLLVDCTDNFRTRYVLNDAAVMLDLPLVHAALYKFEGQLSVFNHRGGPTYRCLYPQPPTDHSIPNCSEVGVLGTVPGLMGLYQAQEVLKIILGIGQVVSGRMLSFNFLDQRSSTFDFERNQKAVAALKRQKKIVPIALNDCEVTPPPVLAEQLNDIAQYRWYDLRKPEETPIIDRPWVHRYPWPEGPNPADQKITVDERTIFFCASGQRALQAAKRYHHQGARWTSSSAIALLNTFEEYDR